MLGRWFKNPTLRTKMLGIAVAAALLPVLVVIALIFVKNRSLQKNLDLELRDQLKDHLGGIAKGVVALCETQHESIQGMLDAHLAVAKDVIGRRGGIRALGASERWEAKDQVSGAIRTVTLPRLGVGGTWLGHDSDTGSHALVVDEVARLVGGTCTIFQRMNPAGDMLRVATNVVSKDGRRAIGTYIPAQNPDDRPNPVVSAVLSGQTYKGRALVVDAWYETSYEPIRDASGSVIGMLYVGVRQEAVASLRRSIMQTEVGKTGYVYVLGGTGDQKGVYIISKDGKRDGENIWEAKDAAGRPFIQEIVNAALEQRDREVSLHYYPWKNQGESKARMKVAAVAYFKPWDWVIGVGAYQEDFEAAKTRMDSMVSSILWWCVLGGLLISGGIVVVASRFSGRVAGPIQELARAAERISLGDVNQSITHRSTDEVGSLSESFRRLIDYIKGVAGAADALSRGDVSVKVEPRSEKDLLSKGFQRAVDSIRGMTGEAHELTRAAQAGKLSVRANATQYQGAYAELVSGLNAALDAVVGPLHDISEALGGLASGDLTSRVTREYQGDYNEVRVAANTLADRFQQAMRQIGESSGSLAAAAEQLSAVSRTMSSSCEETSAQATAVSAAAEQVSKNVQTVAAGSEEMGASIKEIAKSASDSATVAGTAVKSVASTNATMTKLGESSAEIGKVVKVITAIARQTNLLALNATIEAARAGEIGKGFAVVANEVKELAKETAQATEDISKMIEAIQTDTSGALQAIAEIKEVIGQVNDISSSIAGAVEEQTATTNEISRNVSEAASGSSEIARNITGVALAAKSTSEGSGEVLTAATSLSRTAGELQHLVSQFRY